MARGPARQLVSVKLDPSMVEALDRWAGQRGVDRSDFIRWALGRVIATLENPPVPARSKPAPVAAPRAGVPTMDLLDGKRQVSPNFKK